MRSLVIEAEGFHVAAARQGRFRSYQCAAAIQSVHAQRPFTGHVNHIALFTLYNLLAQHAPSLGAMVGHGRARAGRLDRRGLGGSGRATARSRQPLSAVLGGPGAGAGDTWAKHGAAAQQIAIGLALDPAVRAFLEAEPTSQH